MGKMDAKLDKAPFVSIVIPSYNRAHLLGRAIRSVLNQTYKNFEVIVVDDASTDDTAEIVKTFKDDRIQYILHDANAGGAAARNTGIRASRGEYIAFQDSDDEWFPEKLEKQMTLFEQVSAETGVVYTGFWRVRNNHKTYIPPDGIKQKEGDIHRELLKRNFVSTQTVVVKKECLEQSGLFDERLPRLQDWELFIRLSKLYEFKFVAEPLVIAHFTPESISAKKDALIEAKKLILEKHREEISTDTGVLASHLYSIASLSFQTGEMRKGRAYLKQALALRPFCFRFLTALAVSLFGKKVYVRFAKSGRYMTGKNIWHLFNLCRRDNENK